MKFTVDEKWSCGKMKNGHTIVIEKYLHKGWSSLKTDKATEKTIAGAVLQLTEQVANVIDTWESERKRHIEIK